MVTCAKLLAFQLAEAALSDLLWLLNKQYFANKIEGVKNNTISPPKGMKTISTQTISTKINSTKNFSEHNFDEDHFGGK